MINTLAELTRNLLAVIFINVLLEMLLPQGSYHRYIRLVAGLVVMLLVINSMGRIMGRAELFEVQGQQFTQDALRLEERGGDLNRISREQALKLYRDRLLQLVSNEVEAAGRWKLLSASFTLEEDPYSEQYGALYGIRLAVRANASSGTNEIETVSVDPVLPDSEETEEAVQTGEEPECETALLQQALARRLQIPTDIVYVTEE